MKIAVSKFVMAVLTAVLATFALTANASDPFELISHESYLPENPDVESASYDSQISKLEKRLTKSLPHSIRTPILIDLCAAHTIKRNLDKATQYCDQATESGWYSGLAYNNRGVLQIAKGNYEMAARDFEKSIRGRGVDAMAKRNLSRTQARLAEIKSRQQQTTVVAAVVTDD